MKFDILHNFISPVTGYILSTRNYVPYGNRQGIAVPSPIIIDIRLDLINLREKYNAIAAADFVIGHPSSALPEAQVLSNLGDGFMYNTSGEVSTLPLIPITGLPDLTHNYLWTGDDTNRPIEVQRIILDNLPTFLNLNPSNITNNFGLFNLYTGKGLSLTSPTEAGEPGITLRLNMSNMPNLSVGKFWIGVLNYTPPTITIDNIPPYVHVSGSLNWDAGGLLSDARAVPNEIGLDPKQLFIGSTDPTKIGQISVTTALFIDNLPNFTAQNKLWTGGPLVGGVYRPIETTVLDISNMADLPHNKVWVGDITNRPVPTDKLPVEVLPPLPNTNIWIGDVTNQAQPHPTIDIGNLPDLTFDYIWRGDSTNRPVQSNALITVEEDIATILDDIATIQAHLEEIDAALAEIEASIVVIEGEIAALEGEIAAIEAAIAVIQAQIVAMDAAIVALGTRIDNLRLNTIPADGDVSFYGFKGINFADPTSAQDAATKHYVDGLDVLGTAGQIISTPGLVTLTGPNKFTMSLDVSGANAGSYTYPALTVDKFGRITTISNGTGVITFSGAISGTGSLGTTIVTTFNLALNEIADANPATANVKLNDKRLIEVADPINAQDATTKHYVDAIDVTGEAGRIVVSKSLVTVDGPYQFDVDLDVSGVTAGIYTNLNATVDKYGRVTAVTSGSNAIILGGAVSGSGFLGSSVTTTFNLNLNGISSLNATTGAVDLNNNKIINLADPVNPLDAVNYQTLTSFSGGVPAVVVVAGASQTFRYNGSHNAQFVLQNTQAATLGNDSFVDLNFSNAISGGGGYNLKYTSSTTDPVGIGRLTLYPIAISPLTSIPIIDITSQGTNPLDVTNTMKVYATTSFNANVGFGGIITPHAPIQVNNLLSNRLVVLYEGANNDHQFFGFGINSGQLRYQVNNTSDSHVWYAGVSSSSSKALMSLTGDGRLILYDTGTTNANVTINSAQTSTAAIQLTNTNASSTFYGINITDTSGSAVTASIGYNAVASKLSVLSFGVTPSCEIGISASNVFFSSLGAQFNNYVGIGVSPTVPLQFNNYVVNRVISMYDGGNDNEYYGFGINSFTLRYQVATTSASHKWYAGTNSTTSNLLMSLTGTGSLTFPNIIKNNLIVLWDGGNDNEYYGFGINSFTLRYQVATTSASHKWYAGTNSTTSNLLMSLTGTGSLTFPNIIKNNLIVLWDGGNDNQYFGFGINNNVLRYSVEGVASSHKWYAGVNSTTSNLLMTMSGAGDLSITGTDYCQKSYISAYITGAAAYSIVGNVASVVGVGIGAGYTLNSANQFVVNPSVLGTFKYTSAIQSPIMVMLTFTISYVCNSNNGNIVFRIQKNGVNVTQVGNISSRIDQLNVTTTINTVVSVATNDYLGVTMTPTLGTTITITAANIVINAI